MFSLLSFISLAHAEIDISANQFVSLNTTSVVNDPFLKRNGVKIVYHKPVTKQTSVFVHGGYFLDRGEADLSTLTKQIKDDNNVAPDISRVLAGMHAGLSYTIRSIEGTWFNQEPLNIDLLFGGGMGVVQTKDDGTVSGILDGSDNICPDISTLNSNSETALFCQTQIEWQPSTSFHLTVLWKGDGNSFVSTTMNSLTYIETVNSTMLEMKRLLGIEVGYGIQF